VSPQKHSRREDPTHHFLLPQTTNTSVFSSAKRARKQVESSDPFVNQKAMRESVSDGT